MIFIFFYSLILIILVFSLTRLFYIRTIKELTIKDKKTGVYNRAYFDTVYISEFHRARRISHPISLIFLQCDPSLIVAKKLLLSIQRDTDFIAKYQENLYIAVLYDTDSDGTDKVISRIMKNLPEGHTINMGVHAGIPDNHVNSQNMLDEAAKALEKAIKHGENQVEFSLNSI